MQHRKIRDASAIAAVPGEAGADASVARDPTGFEWAESRWAYLDAIHIPAAMLTLEDERLVPIAHNRAFDQVAGGSVAALAGLLPIVRAFIAGGQASHECRWRQPHIGGHHFSAHLTRLPPLGRHRDRVMLSLVDRTSEIETERSLRAEMLLDSLTGLPNRLAFEEAVEAAIAEADGAGNVAVLAINLARFSRINECVGALAGDELILTVASRFVSALRGEAMLARTGGDEFGVMFGGDAGKALELARRLRGVLVQPIRLAELEIRIDGAIGCALLGARAPSAGDVLRDAQAALKRAKASGRVEVYRPGELSHARRRFSLETELGRAIERDQLSLAFQPLIDLDTGAVSGFEALARWTHPEHGIIVPDEFIPVAEDSVLIVPLGRWVLDAAVRTLAAWDAAAGVTLPLKLCVNVSPVQLARDTVASAVASTLTAAGVAGDRLTLELTESSLVADPERARRVLQGLHALGCCVAMDDFGTGYSSLASLQKLPIDVLKIDRSFVTDMHENRDSVAIIRAILGLARALGMSTTAEGIETVETARTLAALGCTTGQGFYFAHPMSASDALDYFLARRA